MAPVHALRQIGQLQLHGEPRGQEDAQRLAEQQTAEHADGHRVRDDGQGIHARQHHAGVREREQRQDEEVHGDVQAMVEARDRRDGQARHAADLGHLGQVLLLHDVGLAGVVAIIGATGAGGEPARSAVELHLRARRDGKRQQHAGDGGVHARHEKARPHPQAHDEVRQQIVDVQPVEHDEHGEQAQTPGQPRHVEVRGVEDGDHHDGDDVVGDGERREERAQPRRDAASQQRENAQAERDIVRHGNAPALLEPAADVHRRVHERRHDGAARRAQDGQQRLARVLQLARRHLELDLKAHQQEENGHEEVVDEVLQREVRREIAQRDADVERAPELGEVRQHRRVLDDERRHGRGQHEHGRARGRVGEFEQLALAPMVAAHFRLEDALGGRTGGIAAQTGGWRLVVRGTVGAGRQPAAFTLRRPVKLRRRLTAFANLGNLASFTR